MLFGLVYPSKVIISDQELISAAEKAVRSGSTGNLNGKQVKDLTKETLKNTNLGWIGRIFSSIFLTGRIQRAIKTAQKTYTVQTTEQTTEKPKAKKKKLDPNLLENLAIALENPQTFSQTRDLTINQKKEVAQFLETIDFESNSEKTKILLKINKQSKNEFSIKDLETLKKNTKEFTDNMKTMERVKAAYIKDEQQKAQVVQQKAQEKKELEAIEDDINELQRDLNIPNNSSENHEKSQTSIKDDLSDLEQEINDLNNSAASISPKTQTNTPIQGSINPFINLDRDLARLAVLDDKFFKQENYKIGDQRLVTPEEKTAMAQTLLSLTDTNKGHFFIKCNKIRGGNDKIPPVTEDKLKSAQERAETYLTSDPSSKKVQDLEKVKSLFEDAEAFFANKTIDSAFKKQMIAVMDDISEKNRTDDNAHLYEAVSTKRKKNHQTVILAKSQGNLHFTDTQNLSKEDQTKEAEKNAMTMFFATPEAFFKSSSLDNSLKQKIAYIVTDKEQKNKNETNKHLYERLESKKKLDDNFKAKRKHATKFLKATRQKQISAMFEYINNPVRFFRDSSNDAHLKLTFAKVLADEKETNKTMENDHLYATVNEKLEQEKRAPSKDKRTGIARNFSRKHLEKQNSTSSVAL